MPRLSHAYFPLCHAAYDNRLPPAPFYSSVCLLRPFITDQSCISWLSGAVELTRHSHLSVSDSDNVESRVSARPTKQQLVLDQKGLRESQQTGNLTLRSVRPRFWRTFACGCSGGELRLFAKLDCPSSSNKKSRPKSKFI